MAKVYVAGPMTGLPGHNFGAFHKRARTLRAMGHTVISPAEITLELQFGKEDNPPCAQDHLAEDIRQLLTCDAISSLPGWEGSCGATCEMAIAKSFGFDRMDEEGRLIPFPEVIEVRRSYPKQFRPEAVPE